MESGPQLLQPQRVVTADPSSKMLTLEQLTTLQSEAMADNVAIAEKMRMWTEEQARLYFESGGTVEPAAAPAELAEEPSAEHSSVWANGETSTRDNSLPGSMEDVADVEDDDDVCSVCLEVYRDRVVTPCAHSFCAQCISTVLRIGSSDSESGPCPNCRRPITMHVLRLHSTGELLLQPPPPDESLADCLGRLGVSRHAGYTEHAARLVFPYGLVEPAPSPPPLLRTILPSGEVQNARPLYQNRSEDREKGLIAYAAPQTTTAAIRDEVRAAIRADGLRITTRSESLAFALLFAAPRRRSPVCLRAGRRHDRTGADVAHDIQRRLPTRLRRVRPEPRPSAILARRCGRLYASRCGPLRRGGTHRDANPVLPQTVGECTRRVQGHRAPAASAPCDQA